MLSQHPLQFPDNPYIIMTSSTIKKKQKNNKQQKKKVWSSNWNTWSSLKRCQHLFFSFLQFSYLSVFGDAVANMMTKSLMFYWMCLPARFLRLHLMFPVAFLFVLITPPPLKIYIKKRLQHFRSGCQSALLIFKGSRAWNTDSEHRPDFHSLIFPPHFPLFQ